MQSKKGLYLLIALISTIFIFFFILFFVHERTLENGILFKVSFQYPGAQNITYNFYNQSGKIEKKEIVDNFENSYLLDKTDYNSVKLLRKLIKGIKESKEISNEEGITIYNGQNKRYYLLPYDHNMTEELAKLIIDGYIHSELKRVTNKTVNNEIYLYQNAKEELTWTKDGATPKIIHTYSCTNENCSFLYTNNKDHETILQDQKYYLYNYVTKSKEELNVDKEISSAKILKYNAQIVGIALQNKEKETAFYDMNKKEILTEFHHSEIEAVNHELLFEVIKKEDHDLLTVWNRTTEEEIWKLEQKSEKNTSYQLSELTNEQAKYYVLSKMTKDKTTYQILNEEWKFHLEGTYDKVELQADGSLRVIITINNKKKYQQYDKKGDLLGESDSLEELEKIIHKN